MTTHFQSSSNVTGGRLCWHILAGIVFGLVAMGQAVAAPASQNGTGAGGTEPYDTHSNSKAGNPFANWNGVLDGRNTRKLARLRICTQSLGGPMHLLEAINICAPCMWATPSANMELTAVERSCIKQRQNDSGDGSQSALGGLQPNYVEPNCSGTTLGHGPQAQDPEVERALNELLEADARLREAEDDEEDAWHDWDNAEGSDQATYEAAADRYLLANQALGMARRQVREAQARYDREVRESHRDVWRNVMFIWNHYVGGGNRSPEPGIGNDLPGAGHEDPRCAGKRRAAEWGVPWQDMCRSEDGKVDLIACVRKMTNVISVITGGRCWMETGPDDAPTMVCRNEDGETANIYDAGSNRGAAGPTDNSETDPTPWNRPRTRSEALGPVADPLEDFLSDLCARGGCPDPAPSHGAIPTGPNRQSRSSNSGPASGAQDTCPEGTTKQRGVCVAVAKPKRPRSAKPLTPNLSNELRSLAAQELAKIRKAKRKNKARSAKPLSPNLSKDLRSLAAPELNKTRKAKRKNQVRSSTPQLKKAVVPSLRVF